MRERISGAIDPAAAGDRTAVVSLTVSADGALQDIAFDAASGSTVFDETLRETVRRAAPFPPLPQAVRERADVLVVTLRLPVQRDRDALRRAETPRTAANPCDLPFSEMIDSRVAKRRAAADPSADSGVRHFRIDDAMNTSPGISVEDERRYNYPAALLTASARLSPSAKSGTDSRSRSRDSVRPA
ncbi:MAG: TonB C-terminal domain-containing protein [Burkholderiales bacterium]|nr:TonB C-terminal domain-containing protein [Burkholderiales bacterium]